ncbi:hypothetical protein Cni_G19386 [Canna indica]|uniref:SWIM-type domain-containing protein n=1 Tax=Canna indica TaxID=4628 RepID=A0AAQ3KN28_9LILI|nr:hypothetical protein Cni_G19386 [Canna indica]
METPRNTNVESSEDEDYCPVGETDDDILSSEFDSLTDEEYVKCGDLEKDRRNNMETYDSGSNETLANILVTVKDPMHNMSEEVPIIVQPTTLNEDLENTIDQGTEWSSEYENSSDEIITPETSQEGVPYIENVYTRKKRRHKVYNPNSEFKDVKFGSSGEFKQAVQNYALVNGYNIKWSKSNKRRKEAKCIMGCPWRIYASWLTNEKTLMVKAYTNEHSCSRNMRNRPATGLEYATKQRVPVAEHRNCVRHVYSNWKKKHNGHVLKSTFWRIVRCTAESEFKRALNELQAISPPTFQDFIAIGVENFCQAFISPQCKCEVVTSNICETFNESILRARSKLLIDMLEDIRRNMKFEVQELDRSYVVNLLNRACSYRYWDICGIPCKHTISCIIWLKEDPNQYVDKYYKREAYIKTYEFLLQPLTGKDTWPEVEGPPVLPPHVKKMPGRPKKKRRREMNEEQSSTFRLSRRELDIVEEAFSRERAIASQGFGVFVGEETRNTYFRMPSSSLSVCSSHSEWSGSLIHERGRRVQGSQQPVQGNQQPAQGSQQPIE